MALHPSKGQHEQQRNACIESNHFPLELHEAEGWLTSRIALPERWFHAACCISDHVSSHVTYSLNDFTGFKYLTVEALGKRARNMYKHSLWLVYCFQNTLFKYLLSVTIKTMEFFLIKVQTINNEKSTI